jgi:hypothetical protein
MTLDVKHAASIKALEKQTLIEPSGGKKKAGTRPASFIFDRH